MTHPRRLTASILFSIVAASLFIACNSSVSQDGTAQQPYIYLNSLPIWREDKAGLEYVATTRQYQPPPSARQIKRFYFSRRVTPSRDALPDGWVVKQATTAGAATRLYSGKIIFTLYQESTGKSASWSIAEPRLPILTDVFNGVSGAYTLSDRYLAFSVTDGSFIFFDRKNGKFVPFAVKASSRSVEEACRDHGLNFVSVCEGDLTALYLSSKGEVIVTTGDDIYRQVPLP